jgi:menaquinone-dependent protoporphyrinogen oxidase
VRLNDGGLFLTGGDIMSKALIVYGTRTGTTAETSEVIAETLRKEGLEVKVVDAKKDKVQSIDEYDLVIVGSGIQMGKWTGEPESFLKKFQKELSTKKVAVFVTCGSANPLSEGEQKKKEMDEGRRKYLDEKVAKYNLKPVALGFFGGCYDFNKMGWFFKKTLSSIKPKLENAGYKESKPGVYDLRDLDAIRSWARDLAKTISS